MCRLTQDKINVNYVRWVDKLKKYDVYSQSMIDDIGEELKNCSFALNDSSGGAYQGSMIDISLNMLCTLAVGMNENIFVNKHQLLKVNTDSLIRVLLLQHISKAVMFVNERQQWKLSKGYLYDFNEKLSTVMKCGERTIFMCMKYGIKLSEEEYEAIRIIDKEDDKTTSFSTPLSTLVKTINQLVVVELRQKWLAEHQDNSEIEK